MDTNGAGDACSSTLAPNSPHSSSRQTKSLNLDKRNSGGFVLYLNLYLHRIFDDGKAQDCKSNGAVPKEQTIVIVTLA